jgi:hypothetical protein
MHGTSLATAADKAQEAAALRAACGLLTTMSVCVVEATGVAATDAVHWRGGNVRPVSGG